MRPEIGKLAVNNDGVYNIPKTEEDCEKSAQWFGNKLVCCIVTEPFELKTEPFTNPHEYIYDIENNTYILAGDPFNPLNFKNNPENYEKILIGQDDPSLIILKIVNKELFNGDYVDVEEVKSFVVTRSKI